MKIKFNACEHLDFGDNYAAKKDLIALGETKVFWMRPTVDPELPTMVQFCKKRGRLNSPEACTSARKAVCGEYYEVRHNVEVEDVGEQ